MGSFQGDIHKVYGGTAHKYGNSQSELLKSSNVLSLHVHAYYINVKCNKIVTLEDGYSHCILISCGLFL